MERAAKKTVNKEKPFIRVNRKGWFQVEGDSELSNFFEDIQAIKMGIPLKLTSRSGAK